MNHPLFMLDTNTVSYLIRAEKPELQKRLARQGISNVCISAITEAELRFGVHQHPTNQRLRELIESFLIRVDILAWGSEAARRYAEVRTHCKIKGFSLSNMDMLIGAHSIAAKATLVTNDKAFGNLSELFTLENWSDF